MAAALSTLVALLLAVQFIVAAPQKRRPGPVKSDHNVLSSAGAAGGQVDVDTRYATSWGASRPSDFNDDGGGGGGSAGAWGGGNNQNRWDWGGSANNGLGANNGFESNGDHWSGGGGNRPSHSGQSAGDIAFGNQWSGNGRRPAKNVVRPPWGSNNNNAASGNNNFGGNPWLSGQGNRPNNRPGSNNNRPNQRPNPPTNNAGFNGNFGVPGSGQASLVPPPNPNPSSINGVRPPSTPRPNCGCDSTNEYNPVCGNDGATYENFGRLRCARMCGKGSLTVKHRGACTTLPPTK